MNPESLSCEAFARRDTVERFVTGTLEGDELARFEAHYFECDRCWEEVQAALEVRAALSGQDVERGSLPGPDDTVAVADVPKPRRWFPLLAAASIAVLAVTIWQLGGRQPAETPAVVRGAERAFDVTVVDRDDSLRATWQPVDGATRHRVRVFTEDGSVLVSGETTEPLFSLPNNFADSVRQTVLLQVEALDDFGSVLAASPLMPLPTGPRLNR